MKHYPQLSLSLKSLSNGLLFSGLIFSSCLLISETASAQDMASPKPAKTDEVDVNKEGALQELLEISVGKEVALRLVTGEELKGTVKSIGPDALLLTQLSGQEFFDAVVERDAVVAVIYRRTTGK